MLTYVFAQTDFHYSMCVLNYLTNTNTYKQTINKTVYPRDAETNENDLSCWRQLQKNNTHKKTAASIVIFYDILIVNVDNYN